jgi:hypothetical protein
MMAHNTVQKRGWLKGLLGEEKKEVEEKIV